MTLDDWLHRLETRHPTAIDLGLERVGQVARALLPHTLPFRIFTVGGTNGKGSVCTCLDSVLRAAGYRVGLYTSPHLVRYNERVRMQGVDASDAALVEAFAAVEAARGGISLTYFEFGTLAAMWLFVRERLDVVVLEVGLGGRLDAVNVFDADCAAVTSIALDHTDYLGDTREAIGFEKAGIYRRGRPAVCGDARPPATLREFATAIGADWRALGEAYVVTRDEHGWHYAGRHWQLDLPLPAMSGNMQIDNAACALAALEAMHPLLPVDSAAIVRGLGQAVLPGRFQRLPGLPLRILDVAHNPHGAAALADNLRHHACVSGRTYAVFAVLGDKDIAGVIEAVRDEVDEWLVAPLEGARALEPAVLLQQLRQAGVTHARVCSSVVGAWQMACEQAGENDRIVAFGSFQLVAPLLRAIAGQPG